MAGNLDFTPAPKARRVAVFSTIGTAVLCVLAQMWVNVFGQALSFLMLPTLAVYLWPKGANSVFSLIGVFFVGLLQDHLSYGPDGLWPLTWMMLFLICRPDMRPKAVSMIGQWSGVLIVLTGVVLFQLGLAKFILGRSIDMRVLGLSAAATFFLFPPFYLVREYLARAFGNREEFYYESPAR